MVISGDSAHSIFVVFCSEITVMVTPLIQNKIETSKVAKLKLGRNEAADEEKKKTFFFCRYLSVVGFVISTFMLMIPKLLQVSQYVLT